MERLEHEQACSTVLARRIATAAFASALLACGEPVASGGVAPGPGDLSTVSDLVAPGGALDGPATLPKPAIPWNEWLPPDHATSGKTYPLVVWLHGKGGDEHSGAMRVSPLLDAAGVEAIYVYPGAGEMAWSEGDGYLIDQIVDVLIPYVLGTPAYRADGQVHFEGFSMGGNGCYAVCANKPGLCKSIVSYGAAMLEPSHFSGKYSPWDHIDSLKSVRIRQVIGTADNTQASNHAYHELLALHGVAHEFISLPGVVHSPGPYYEAIEAHLGDEDPFRFHFVN